MQIVDYFQQKKTSQMFDWVLNTPLYMEGNEMRLINFSKISPRLFL